MGDRKYLPTMGEFRKFAEQRALAADSGSAGGYLLTGEMLNELAALERDYSVIRTLARVLPPITGDEVGRPTIENEPVDAEWVGEIGSLTDDSTLSFGKATLKPQRIAKRIKVSRKLLRAPMVGEWVLSMLAAAVAAPQEKAYLQGGAGMDGILSNALVPTYTTTAVGDVTGDDLRGFIYSLPNRFYRRPSIVTTSTFLKHVLHLIDGQGNFLFPDYQGRLLNVPVYFSDGMPAIESGGALISGACAMVIGNFYDGYWIADGAGSTEVRRFDQLYATENEVGFQLDQESAGGVVSPNAFYKLVIKA